MKIATGLRDDWDKRTRFEKLAAVAFPALVSDGTRKLMAERAANERKKPPAAMPLIPDHKRGAVSPLGGSAKAGR